MKDDTQPASQPSGPRQRSDRHDDSVEAENQMEELLLSFSGVSLSNVVLVSLFSPSTVEAPRTHPRFPSLQQYSNDVDVDGDEDGSPSGIRNPFGVFLQLLR